MATSSFGVCSVKNVQRQKFKNSDFETTDFWLQAKGYEYWKTQINANRSNTVQWLYRQVETAFECWEGLSRDEILNESRHIGFCYGAKSTIQQ